MQEWHHDIPTRYFATYEALEDAFRDRVAGLVPRFHAGTRVFWDDFQALYDSPTATGREHCEAYITSNPRDCLAFGTPLQVLRGAWLSAARRHAAPDERPEQVAAQFGLGDHLHQSIRSLSGGETVRLALAKAYLLAACAARLTVASPFSWLAFEHWHDFRALAARYRARGTPLELFALQGEDTTTAAPADEEPQAPPLTFTWRLQALTLDLGSLLDRLYDRPVRAEVASLEEELISPCLLCGDNGQGKSLVAKALAAATPCSGEAAVIGDGGPLRVRLLFQDVLNQTLMRTMRQLIPRGRGSGLAAAYDAIVAGVRRRAPASRKALPVFADRCRDHTPLSLLEIKILLVAVRMGDHGTGLILDEPDWGLSRCDAIAFVSAVVSAAHARSVPVILISHKPWWRNLAGSVRWVHKEAASSSSVTGCLFRIRIRNEPGGAP